MSYKTLGWRPSYISGEEPVTIFVIPMSSRAEDFRIVYPTTLEKNLAEILTDRALRVRVFEGCPAIGIETIRDYISAQLRRTEQKTAGGINIRLVLGVVLIILGVIDWTFPDPLPFIDELAMVLGGGAIVGWSFRQKKLFSEWKGRVREAADEAQRLESEPDSLLTRIFQSIKVKGNPEITKPGSLDRIELEAQWFVKYLNVRDMIESEEVTADNVREVSEALQDIMPLKSLLRSERGYPRYGARARLKLLRERTMRRLNLTDDALDVYCAFFRSAQEYFEREGLQLP